MNENLADSAVAWICSQLELSTGSQDLALPARVAMQREAFHVVAVDALERLGLGATELAALLTLLAVELDPTADVLLSSIDASRRKALRRFVYGQGASLVAHQELGPQGRLTTLGLVQWSKTTGGADVRITDHVLRFLLGDVSADPVLASCLSNQRETPLELNEMVVTQCDVERALTALAGHPAVIVVVGKAGVGRRSLLSAAAQRIGIKTLEIDARGFSEDPDAFQEQVRALSRDCRFTRRAPLLMNIEALADTKNERIRELVAGLGTMVKGHILATSGVQRPTIKWDRPTIVIEMGQPTTAQRATLWHSALGEGTVGDAQLLAEQYPLAPALICNAAEAAKARANGRPLEPEDIYAGIRTVLDDRLGQFAKRVTVTQTWRDLVLPPEQLDTIVELMARVRGRSKVYEQWGFAAKVGKGLGVSALFSGPPGTGKTMVAALIARDLGLELYQVDMAKIVSKYIGETEKNLGALFDAAEAGHAILLFDEADALFGKRTDVKSSNDRYANLETNYLLQRLETFTGICLLTSNHESHIDPAFQRRLSLHLRFELPEVDEREQLWRATLPAAAPLADSIDFSMLARKYAMSGGYIRNAALRAAFLAADEDSAITAAHLERAARVEYEGMGKIAA